MINLQLFAMTDKFLIMAKDGGGKKTEDKKPETKSSGYDPYSVVDYMKSQGMDSSYSARSQLASELGISGYKGSGEQNTQLLNMLKNGATGGNKNADTSAFEVEEVDEVDTEFKASNKATKSQKKADDALDYLTSMASPTISQDVLDVLNSSFSSSSAYKEAMQYTNSLLEKLSSGRTSYTDQIKEMMNKIQNREKFSYDVENDTLFQQALASAMGSGKQAMQDTIGQASALTGGYASTYATSAGNQAYNAYIEDAYNNLPEYYQMAMEAYNMEGQEMYNQLNMLNQADATEYGRLYDSWNANFTNAQNMYNQEYGAWQDSVNNAYNNANLQLKQQGMIYDQAYNNYTALQGNAEILYSQEYKQWQDSVNLAYDNYWKQQDNQYRYDSLAQNQSQFDAEMKYKNDALAQDKDQFNARYDLNNDGVVNYEDQQIEDSGSKKIDQKYMTGAVEAMNAGGMTKLNEYLNSLSGIYSEKELEQIAEYAGAYSDWIDMDADYDWKMVDDGGWHLGKLDDDAVVSMNGKEMDIQALYEKLLEQGMSKKEAKDYIVKLQGELGI